MPLFDDHTEIATINCPHGHPVKVTLGEARASKTVKCRRCDSVIVLDGSDFRRKLAEIERQLRDLGR